MMHSEVSASHYKDGQQGGTSLYQSVSTWLSDYWHVGVLIGILAAATALRLIAYTEFNNGSIQVVGSCGPLFDEAKALFDSKNPLHFEVFFYPPVPAIMVASTAILAQQTISPLLDFAHYCLLFSIGISVATLIIIYLIGKEWGQGIALLATSFYAVSMIAVDCSNTVQAYATFFSMGALYYFYKSLHQQSLVNLALMGTFLGLGIASKYFPVMLSLMLFLPYIMSRLGKINEPVSKEEIESRAKTRSHALAGSLIHGMLWVTLIMSILSVFVVLSQKHYVMSVAKNIYDRYPHENGFEYHNQAFSSLLQIGLLGAGGIGLLAGLALYLPYKHGHRTLDGIYEFFRKNWLWLTPCLAVVVTCVLTIAVPSAINLNNYLKYTVWITKGYGSADSGFFPAGNRAPSYFLSYFPENLGLPLFFLGCLGIGYSLYTKNRKGILLLIISLPLYVALELSLVKVNRYALDLMPSLCLFAAIAFLPFMQKKQPAAFRIMALLAGAFVLVFSTTYSLAWANVERSLRSIPFETARWINANVPEGSRLGMKAQLWIAGSPNLLPDPAALSHYELVDYTAQPDFIILPKTLFEIMKQYSDLSSAGYRYKPEDWSPSSPPTATEERILLDLVNERHYEMVKEFEGRPTIWGFTFGLQSLSGRTWFLEHTGSYGIQVYRLRSDIRGNHRSNIERS